MERISFLYSVLMSDDVVKSINNHFDELMELIPELSHEINFEHKHPHHHLDVWNHTLMCLSLSEKDFEVRLALLLHDIGKPFSYTEEKKIRHFRNHPQVSFEMTEKIMKRLGASDDFSKRIGYLVLYHDVPITDEDITNYPNLTLKRYEVQRCDALSHHPDKLTKRKEYLDVTYQKIKKLFKAN